MPALIINILGCATLVLHSEKAEHEKSCDFRPYACLFAGAGCKWTGPLDQVMPHFKSSHKSVTTLHGKNKYVAEIINFSTMYKKKKSICSLKYILFFPTGESIKFKATNINIDASAPNTNANW